MLLTSARDAKLEVGAELARAVAEVQEGGEPSPTVAVGVGVRPGEGFVVAIRSESATGRIVETLTDLVARRGRDVDARVIGQVRAFETSPFRQRLRPLVP